MNLSPKYPPVPYTPYMSDPLNRGRPSYPSHQIPLMLHHYLFCCQQWSEQQYNPIGYLLIHSPYIPNPQYPQSTPKYKKTPPSRVGKKWEPRNPVPGPFSAKIRKVNQNSESRQEFGKQSIKLGKFSGKLGRLGVRPKKRKEKKERFQADNQEG